VNVQEVAAVVAKIKLGDNRAVDKLVIQEWENSIGDLPYQDAIEAVTMFRRESDEYLQPVHIIRNVKRIREDRSQGQGIAASHVAHPASKPANWAAMCRAWNNEAAWSRELDVYRAQLRAEGYQGVMP
jgi:hypothetical protein